MDDVAGTAVARGRRGGGGDESDGSSGGVELSLGLRTGSRGPAAAEQAGRSMMTIFYHGRVCAVDVTEIQARAIISMASHESSADQLQRGDSGSSSAGGYLRPAAANVAPAASPRAVAASVIDQVATGLSMKRSLQRFLQKRKARTAAAVAPPYADGRPAHPIRH
ncbi:protein TIFY 5-like [Phragmites australis]|uniref:protein TIFY 5-like n=1 Tax=Phragmites australis TaxID=29695 RepID=UPI002D78AA34|nr:protein TIFY 5-like [Phragmites australis]